MGEIGKERKIKIQESTIKTSSNVIFLLKKIYAATWYNNFVFGKKVVL